MRLTAARTAARRPLCSSHSARVRSAIGTKITGVDDQTYSSTGEAYSNIVLSGADSHHERVLQEDDVSLGKSAHALTCCPYINRVLNRL